MYLVQKELTENCMARTASGHLVQTKIKIDKRRVSGCGLDELSRTSDCFFKNIFVPQTVTRSVVQETFLLLPALLFWSGRQSTKRNS